MVLSLASSFNNPNLDGACVSLLRSPHMPASVIPNAPCSHFSQPYLKLIEIDYLLVTSTPLIHAEWLIGVMTSPTLIDCIWTYQY